MEAAVDDCHNLVMFGLGWGISLLATQTLYTTVVWNTFSVLFIFLTAFQGMFIFILHCAQSTKVVNQWKKWLSCVTKEKSEDITSSILAKCTVPSQIQPGQLKSTALLEDKATLEIKDTTGYHY